MKIDHQRPSEHGRFTIEASEGRTLTDVFRDATTGLLIVEEHTEGKRGFRRKLVTTVDPESGQILSIEERKSRIDYAETRVRDAASKLELRCSRMVDAATGVETIYERLVAESGAEVQRTTRDAFARSTARTLLESHNQARALEAEREKFWTNEYAAKDFAVRAAYWAGLMFRHMRWQTESGLDPCAGFDRAWFEDAKRREPDFERMFDHILQRYEQDFLHEDVSPAEIRRRVRET
ncbi:MAG: hypothetical protein JST00_31545 [Deltaproteobacteria bacterium]|nr:hypothetical protein [Deltaproteobacteria bacterium]